MVWEKNQNDITHRWGLLSEWPCISSGCLVPLGHSAPLVLCRCLRQIYVLILLCWVWNSVFFIKKTFLIIIYSGVGGFLTFFFYFGGTNGYLCMCGVLCYTRQLYRKQNADTRRLRKSNLLILHFNFLGCYLLFDNPRRQDGPAHVVWFPEGWLYSCDCRWWIRDAIFWSSGLEEVILNSHFNQH